MLIKMLEQPLANTNQNIKSKIHMSLIISNKDIKKSYSGKFG